MCASRSDIYVFNYESLEKGLNALMELPGSDRVREAAKPVAEELLSDTLELIPTVPMDTGRLRASGSVFIDGELVKVSSELGYSSSEGTPLKSIGREGKQKDASVIAVVYNTPYAAAVHEMPATTNWTTEGSGAKYIENTLKERGEHYLKRWFEAIKSMMQGQRKK